ncbi:MAG: helix-turn-helix domain-containing protein [Bacteroidota bacterium]|nr:helix-turn-helix domain-containing protein [Bacteroidota bacterium]
MIEERKKFVDEVLNPNNRTSFSEICRNYNIAPKTGYKWVNNFYEKGLEGLNDLSRTPHSNPNAISSEVKNQVIAIRHQYPKWGPKKIQAELKSLYVHLKIPSEGSIGNILSENNLSAKRLYRKHMAKTAPLVECIESNHTWMYDFKGWFLTGDKAKCEPLTITDGFSRYLILCQNMSKKGSSNVWSELEKVFYEFGLPLRMRSDNGAPFASLAVGRLSSVAIKLIKVGVIPEWIKPGCPQENGRHERFHLTLKNETAFPPALSLSLQQEKFDQFKKYYNNIRYHEALNQKKPVDIYKPSPRIWDGKFRSPEYSSEYEIRKVCAGGNISWKGTYFFISEVLKGEYVGLIEIEVGLMEIYYGPILLGMIDMNKGFKRI